MLAYETHLLHRQSVHMERNGLLKERLPRPQPLASNDLAHCYAVILDLDQQRVLVIDSLAEKDSVYRFQKDGTSPDFSMASLADLLVHPRFVKHNNGRKDGWLRNCRMLHADYPCDSECLKHALALCSSAVNTVGDFDKRWDEAGEGRVFQLCPSKAKL